MDSIGTAPLSTHVNLWQHFRLLAMRMIYFGVALVLLLITVLKGFEHKWLHSSAVLLVALGFFAIGILYRQRLAPQWINFICIVSLGVLASLAMKSSGIAGVYWMYPILAMVFFMFDKAIFVLVIMLIYAAFAAVMYQFLPFEYAWQIAISMLVLIGVGTVFLVMMAGMQRNLIQANATDTLTGCYHRDYLEQILRQQITKNERLERPLSVIQLDLDGFKLVNDKYGYMFGDRVLQETAARIKRVVRATDIIVRSNGAQFSIIMPDTPLKLAVEIGSDVLNRIRHEPFMVKTMMTTVTASAGIAQHKTGKNWQDLIEAVDTAMDRAKSQGRNRLKVAQ
ncbi:GGDEF domain-containing protein [Pseudidiomarina mangrovi]|uniref:GGDEF domain-containing protein n=1 Tax=Pseudidiomarina mangrovi TaxID=2487133 RepID=UPI000FCB6EFB|nr:GGDEF domain-containing protein [Pseudidiomarina mangrovi]